MKIEITANKDDYDATLTPITLTETEEDSHIWLEVGGKKVSVNTKELLKAVSVFHL